MNAAMIKKALTALFLTMLVIYFGAIVYINFCGDPLFYNGDMYTDMMYAVRAWEEQSVFPDGWVFGNQLYVVATPVLTALLYGLLGDPVTALGFASSLMSVGVLFSFDWMLRRITKDPAARALGSVALLSLMLYFGDAVYETNGWQLLFTMASYYACYALTAFLAFGCFLRRRDPKNTCFLLILALTCLLCFGTGIQSLRQTAVMACPLVAVEVISLLIRWLRKETISLRSVWVSSVMVASNLLGFAVSRFAALPSVAIYGQIHLQTLPEMVRGILPSIYSATSLLSGSADWIDTLFRLVLAGGAVVVCLRYLREKDDPAGECLLLLIIGLAVILAIDVGTGMLVRSIYYFMIYPLTAFALVMLFQHGPKPVRLGCVAVMLMLFAINSTDRLQEPLTQQHTQTPSHRVAQYMEENDYRTIYTGWDWGCRMAVAARCRVQAGFWNTEIFIPIRYLCDSAIFEEDPARCVYGFRGTEALFAEETAAKQGKTLTLVQYFPDYDIYLYTANENLMK